MQSLREDWNCQDFLKKIEVTSTKGRRQNQKAYNRLSREANKVKAAQIVILWDY